MFTFEEIQEYHRQKHKKFHAEDWLPVDEDGNWLRHEITYDGLVLYEHWRKVLTVNSIEWNLRELKSVMRNVTAQRKGLERTIRNLQTIVDNLPVESS